MNNLDQTFHALSDHARRDLLVTLSRGSQTAGALAEPYEISRPAISRHLRVLRDAGLVRVEVRGRERWYHLEESTFAEAQQWMAELSSMWQQGLQALKTFVEEGQ